MSVILAPLVGDASEGVGGGVVSSVGGEGGGDGGGDGGGGAGVDTVSDHVLDQLPALPAPSIARMCHEYVPSLRASPDASV